MIAWNDFEREIFSSIPDTSLYNHQIHRASTYDVKIDDSLNDLDEDDDFIQEVTLYTNTTYKRNFYRNVDSSFSSDIFTHKK